jgi:hypothetical protein
MRRHYESLNYLDAQVGSESFRFTRTQGCSSGYIQNTLESRQVILTRANVEALRDMLNEVLDDWKVSD